MTAFPERRRRRMIAAVACSVLALVSLPGGLYVGAMALLNDSGGDTVNEAVSTIPNTPVELLVVTSARNEVAAIALLALDPGDHGGTIVSIPVGSAADVAEDEAPRRIVDEYAVGGLESVRAEVEDLTNITVDFATQVTASDLATLLGGVGSREVTLADDVTDTSSDGKTVKVLESGTQTINPQQLANALAASPVGVPESTRLPQVKALWGVVASAGMAGSTDGASTTTADPGDQTEFQASFDPAGFFAALLSGRIDVWQISATPVTDPVANPAGSDLYAVDAGEILLVMASVAPSALSLTSNDVAVMVDVPFDNMSAAKDAVTRLAFLKANVVLVRNVPGPVPDRTTVFYNEPVVRAEMEDFSTLIGPLEFAETTDVIEGVNARVLLGNDFLSFIGTALAVTTTTSPTTRTTVAG